LSVAAANKALLWFLLVSPPMCCFVLFILGFLPYVRHPKVWNGTWFWSWIFLCGL
jgi:hypothetical protein